MRVTCKHCGWFDKASRDLDAKASAEHHYRKHHLPIQEKEFPVQHILNKHFVFESGANA